MKRRRHLVIYVIVIVCILAVLPCFYFIGSKEMYELDKDMYCMSAGIKVDYNKGHAFVKKKDGVQEKETGEPVGALPLYDKESEKLFLTDTYAIVFPEQNGKMERVNYFTEIVKKDGNYFAARDEKERMATDAFLFDGEDTYIFLTEATLSYHNKTVPLAPLSYVRVGYGQDLEYYNPETDQYERINGVGEVTAACMEHTVVRLDTDAVTAGGKQMLLYGTPENLNLYE